MIETDQVNIYDNGGKTLDRYTICLPVLDGIYHYISSSETGAGIYMHEESKTPIDKPCYKHLGKKVKFEDLDSNLQNIVKNDLKGYK